MIVRLTVPGEPCAKGRPRITTIRGFARAYTPAKTVRYENLVKTVAAEAMRGRSPISEPVAATIVCRFTIPKSATKAMRAAITAGKLRPTKRPDLENVLKSIFDGMNGVVFHDDSQIVELRAVKLYGETPGVHVIIEPWGNS